MNRGIANYLLASIFAVGLVGIGIWLWTTKGDASGAGGGRGDDSARLGRTAQLMFPGPGNMLHTETRELDEASDEEERLRRLVEALLEGPQTEGLFRPFPEGIELASILIATDGTAIVDLASSEGGPPPSSGSTEELLAVYSLVNTVLLDAPDLRRVALLWNGQHRPTLAGHVDLTRPLGLARQLIAGEPSPAAS